MFELYVKTDKAEKAPFEPYVPFSRYEPFDRVELVCPILPVRLDIMAFAVASELSELGYYSPVETPRSVVTELLDMAVARHFPGMDRFAWNERYVAKMVNAVGSRAFALLEHEMI